MGDVDWDDLLPAVIDRALAPLPVAPPPQQEVAGPAPPPQPHLPLHVRKVFKRKLKRKRFLAVNFPAPKNREPHHHVLVASRMRERKALKRSDAHEVSLAIVAESTIAKLRAAGVRVGVRAAAIVRSSGLHLVGIKRKRKPLPWAAMLDISYGGVTRRNQAARVHELPPQKITEVNGVVAYAWSDVYCNLCDGISAYCEHKSPSIFGTSISFDESKEKVTLPLHPGLAPTLIRSSWNCLVSTQRFIWSFDDVGADACPRWHQVDILRPNAPIMTTSAECLIDGLYTVPQVRRFTACEQAGLAAATIGLVHYDRAGAAANTRAIMARMSTLDEGTLASDCECCNHHNNLTETCSVAAIDEKVIPWMYGGCLFFAMGGNALRLVHSVIQLVAQYMPRSLRTCPPPEAQAASNELKDFAMTNWKTYQRAISIDADDDSPFQGREQRRLVEYSRA